MLSRTSFAEMDSTDNTFHLPEIIRAIRQVSALSFPISEVSSIGASRAGVCVCGGIDLWAMNPLLAGFANWVGILPRWETMPYRRPAIFEPQAPPISLAHLGNFARDALRVSMPRYCATFPGHPQNSTRLNPYGFRPRLSLPSPVLFQLFRDSTHVRFPGVCSRCHHLVLYLHGWGEFRKLHQLPEWGLSFSRRIPHEVLWRR